MNDIQKYIENLVKECKYKPLNEHLRYLSREKYIKTIPDYLFIDGSTDGLITKSGKKITYYGYDRIVIGDYGAYI